MARPQIIVTVDAAVPRRGAPTETGTAFIVYAGASGPATPTECLSAKDATDANAPTDIVGYVGDALTQGAPKVILLRATAANPSAVTNAEWDTALDKLHAGFGPGQVLLPGVSSGDAHDALLDHADSHPNRTVLLDHAKNDTAVTIGNTATALAAADGAERATIVGGWVKLPGPAGVPRDVPGSVVVAGLVARGDAAVGHCNQAPAGDQGRSAGYIIGSKGLVTAFTDAEHDALHTAGVSVFRNVRGIDQLYGWVALTNKAEFRQLNWGRMAMQLTDLITVGVEQFLFRQIDPEGRLYAQTEGLLRGLLAPLWPGALRGASADEAFDVAVASINTPTTAAAGELHAAVTVSLSAHTEQITINVITNVAQGV